MIRLAAIAAALVLSGCATPGIEPVARPEIAAPVARCPDPDDRARLGEGSTFRDLAASRIEALDGWERCFFAAGENANAGSPRPD